MPHERDELAIAALSVLVRERLFAFAEDAVSYVDMLADVLPVVVHEGSRVLDAAVLESIDVFTGDLTVRGILDAKSMPGNYGAMLIVLGDLRTRSIVWDGGPMFVAGNLLIDDVGFFRSDGFGLFVGGDLCVDVFVEEDGGVDVKGEQRCRVAYRRGQDASALFSDAYTYDVGGWRAPDVAPMLDAIRAGVSIEKI